MLEGAVLAQTIQSVPLMLGLSGGDQKTGAVAIRLRASQSPYDELYFSHTHVRLLSR